MYPPPGATFDPETVAVLTAAYENAIKGQPVSTHEIIVKRIIELASEGERDPVRPSDGALALMVRSTRSIG
jgi:hypothetical protein